MQDKIWALTDYVVNSVVVALEGAIFSEWRSVAKVLHLYTRPDNTCTGCPNCSCTQEGAHEHIAEAKHFFGSNPGGTTLKCENWNFSWKVEITWGCRGTIWFIEFFFKNHQEPRSKLSKLLMYWMKRRSSFLEIEIRPHWAELQRQKSFSIGLAGEKISKICVRKFSQIMVPRFQKCEKKKFEKNFQFFFQNLEKIKKNKLSVIVLQFFDFS